jgi:hypothetical protein
MMGVISMSVYHRVEVDFAVRVGRYVKRGRIMPSSIFRRGDVLFDQ